MIDKRSLTITRSVTDARNLVAGWRARGLSVGLVPTMGSLHVGHLALIERARSEHDRVLATIFVNPLQFGPTEDFAAYPRDDAGDFTILSQHACDAVFAPSVREMFGADDTSLDTATTRIMVPHLSTVLCGASRPGHFDGVATIVLKLLQITQPDSAYFGEKDYQQVTIVRRVVDDLCVPVRIVGVPIVREADGLAMSSRNAYLSAAQRRIAPALYRVLRSIADAVAGGAGSEKFLAGGRSALLAAGFERVDYVTLAAPVTLASLTASVPGARLFGAAWLGSTRLIDNLAVVAQP